MGLRVRALRYAIRETTASSHVTPRNCEPGVLLMSLLMNGDSCTREPRCSAQDRWTDRDSSRALTRLSADLSDSSFSHRECGKLTTPGACLVFIWLLCATHRKMTIKYM